MGKLIQISPLPIVMIMMGLMHNTEITSEAAWASAITPSPVGSDTTEAKEWVKRIPLAMYWYHVPLVFA